MGILALAQLIDNGPATVRALIAQGDPHRALALARFLASSGHPEAQQLITEARRAIQASPQTEQHTNG